MSVKKLSFATSFFSFLALARPAFAAIAPLPDPGSGYATLDQLTNVFVNVTSFISTFIGFALLLMLIRGGVGYITAQGDPKAVASARATITWALIGFIVVLAAYLIVALIANFFVLPGIGKFCIPKGGGIPYSCT